MTEKQEEHSPFGRGFIAASIVIGAVFVCGLLLLLTGLTPPSPTASATASTPNPSTADSPTPDSTNSPLPGNPSDPTAPTNPADPPTPGDRTVPGDQTRFGDPTGSGDPTNPADPTLSGDPTNPGDSTDPALPETSATRRPAGASACGLPEGDQRVPNTPPAVDGWDVSRRVVVPRSRTSGPAKVDADGFRHCFAHSPSGALFAAYNAISAMGDQRKAVATVGKLMLPGPDTDALLRELRQESPSEFTDPTHLAGYRVLDASRDRFTVMLALPVQSEYVSATLTLAWHEGDWRLAPPRPGEPVGAPYSQHRDLDGFVAWSGL
jgi:hypothetical protein